MTSECLNVFEFSEHLDGARALIPVFSWVVETKVLLISRGWLGTMQCGPSPCTVPKQCHSPLMDPLPRKGRVFWGQLASLTSLHDLARGPYSLSYLLLAGGCLWPPFLDYSKTARAISTAMIASRLWAADYSQSCLTLLENRVGFVPF